MRQQGRWVNPHRDVCLGAWRRRSSPARAGIGVGNWANPRHTHARLTPDRRPHYTPCRQPNRQNITGRLCYAHAAQHGKSVQDRCGRATVTGDWLLLPRWPRASTGRPYERGTTARACGWEGREAAFGPRKGPVNREPGDRPCDAAHVLRAQRKRAPPPPTHAGAFFPSAREKALFRGDGTGDGGCRHDRLRDRDARRPRRRAAHRAAGGCV